MSRGFSPQKDRKGVGCASGYTVVFLRFFHIPRTLLQQQLDPQSAPC